MLLIYDEFLKLGRTILFRPFNPFIQQQQGEWGKFRDGESGKFRDGESGKFRDGKSGKFRDGESGKFRDGESEKVLGWGIRLV